MTKDILKERKSNDYSKKFYNWTLASHKVLERLVPLWFYSSVYYANREGLKWTIIISDDYGRRI
jgi:hypothetical protein